MKRFLFIVPPFTGHVNPTVSVARMLEANGHEVAWVGYGRAIGALLPPKAKLFALDDDQSTQAIADLRQRGHGVRGIASLQFFYQEYLLPFTRLMLPGVLEVVRSYRPDVLIVDQQAFAGTLAARCTEKRWATFCTTSATVIDPLSGLPEVKRWANEQVAVLEREVGLAPSGQSDLSGELVIVFSTQDFVGQTEGWPSSFHFVGPSIQCRPDATPFPWEKLDKRPRVFASLGTVSAEAGDHFYAALVEAFKDSDLQVIVAAPPERLPGAPANFLVRERVPQLALLPQMDAVISHGGHNTVCETLANGIPLVVVPIRDDQPIVANQVVRAGAGIRVRFGRIASRALRDATFEVLEKPRYRQAADRIGRSFAAAGGAKAAAALLEGLA